MDISAKEMQYIERVITVADIVGIDSIIIEPSRVRATNDSGEVFILQTSDVPDMAFRSIGIGKTSIFKSRYSVVKDLKTTFTAITNKVMVDGQEEEFARSITMKAPSVQIDFRCTNPVTIRSPKKVLDPVVMEIPMNQDVVDMLAKAERAMSAGSVDFILREGVLSFDVKDVNGDAFVYEIGGGFDEELEFSHTYNSKVLVPILKNTKETSVSITKLGLIITDVKGFLVHQKPMVQ